MPSKSKAKGSGLKNTTNLQTQTAAPKDKKGLEHNENTPPAVKSTISIPPANQKSSPSSNTQQHSPPQVSVGAPEDGANLASGVNRKKQKRRMKEAAKRAAADLPDAVSHSHDDGSAPHINGYDYATSDYEGAEQYGPDDADDIYYTDEASRNYAAQFTTGLAQSNGYSNHNYISPEPLGVGKKNKKQRSNNTFEASYQAANNIPLSKAGRFQRAPPPPPPPLSQSHLNPMGHAARDGTKDRIWNTSTAEERERIKEFWLSLGEGDRRGLVRIEKEAVLKKMKEQQKHSCSCTVCGRKRTAIEEELEVLYDAYYEELETYANHQQFGLDASSIPPPRSYARPKPHLPPSQHPVNRGGQHSRGHIEELDDEDDAGDEEEYSDEDEDDETSDNDIDAPMRSSGGIFNFGNSLTAQGGILTVADDLLKNDGKKFIEMMEQLAERRMQREEESRMVAGGMGHPSMRHGPPEEEDDGFDDEEDEEDYNSEEDDEFEDDEMEAMTEEQRMEEGRRMFQIFAARMFEQRVLNAYRQKVAEERQKKLIEELAEDEQLDAQREAKRAKEAQKKKDKRQKQKQAKDEEKAKRDAEKAAEEAAARAIEEKKQEEQRQRKEEQRKKKEAEKKAAEDERKRKEEEKHRQLQERKEQQAELERKQREQKEREKKKREEAKRKEREDREAKEKELREKKDRELAERRDRENKAKDESIAKEHMRQDEALRKQAASAPKRQSPANAQPAITPISSSLLPPITTSSHASPRLPIATPVLPKAPTPGRMRQKSFQDSRTTSPKLSQPASSSTASPAGSSEKQTMGSTTHSRKTSHHGPIQPPTQSRFSPAGVPTSIASQPPGFASMTPMASNGFHSTFAPPMSPMSQHGQPHHPPGFPNQYSVSGNHYRNNNIPYPPGINTARQFPPSHHANNGPMMSQGGEIPHSSATNNVGRFGMSHDPLPTSTHSRNQSTSSNISPRDPNPRPAPIQRPSSVTPHHPNENLRPSSRDIDDLSNHLGSSALLDDTDVAPDSAIEDLRRGGMAVGGPRVPRQGFGGAPSLAPIGTSARTENGQHAMNMWPNSQSAFGPTGRTGQPFAPAPGFGRFPNGNAFGSPSAPVRSTGPRALRVRHLVSTICDKWTVINPASQGWHVIDQVCNELQIMMPRNEPAVPIREMLQICYTEGNAQNGGGLFQFDNTDKPPFLMKHITDTNGAMNGKAGPPPGDIGSPNSGGGIGGNNLVPIGGQAPFQQPGRF